MLKLFTNTLIVLALTLIKISFFNPSPTFVFINPVLLFIIFLSIRNNSYYIILAVIAGYMLDLYSYNIFGINILALTSVAIFTNYVYFNILTNHRFIPLVILIAVDITIYNFIVFIASSFTSFLKIFPQADITTWLMLQLTLKEITYTIIFVSITYLIIKFIIKKFRKAFLRNYRQI